MGLRTDTQIFLDLWPVLQHRVKDKQERIAFVKELMQDFVSADADLSELESIHPDIKEAINSLKQSA